MQGPGTDIFATKGIEYILVLGFLLAFIFFARLLSRGTGLELSPAGEGGRKRGRWFRVPAGHFFHQGHAWARVEDADTVRIGIDDFAQRLLGRPKEVRLPEVGSRLEQGARGWSLVVGSKPIALLSPVGGEVVEINPAVLGAPGLVNDDPYGAGWLMKIRVPEIKRNLTNLMTGDLAAGWMSHTEEKLRRRIAGEGPVVMQDGGAPVEGIVQNLGDEEWEKIAAEFLGGDVPLSTTSHD